jgi:hypothetical protein
MLAIATRKIPSVAFMVHLLLSLSAAQRKKQRKPTARQSTARRPSVARGPHRLFFYPKSFPLSLPPPEEGPRWGGWRLLLP